MMDKNMKNNSYIRWFYALAIPALIYATAGFADGSYNEVAQENLAHMTGNQLARIVKGGRLYNNLSHEVGTNFKGTHHMYPTNGKKKGGTTWRCKECHGWDGRGKDGAYGSGSHFTGIGGVVSMMGRSVDEAIASFSDKKHGYGKALSDSDKQALGWYLSRAQLLQEDKYIDRESKAVNGNPYEGGRIFQTICARCHGTDGKLINFGSSSDPEYLGTVASDNPWEGLHNIRFGHPGQQMPSLIAFSLQTQLDVLAYGQTLPSK